MLAHADVGDLPHPNQGCGATGVAVRRSYSNARIPQIEILRMHLTISGDADTELLLVSRCGSYECWLELWLGFLTAVENAGSLDETREIRIAAARYESLRLLGSALRREVTGTTCDDHIMGFDAEKDCTNTVIGGKGHAA